MLSGDSFATLDATDPPAVLVWLRPLRSDDAELVRREGWDAFEDRLEETEIDFGDLSRPPVGHG